MQFALGYPENVLEHIDNMLRDWSLPQLWQHYMHVSLFKKADTYIAVVEALSRKRMGMTRKEIVKETGVKQIRLMPARVIEN